MGFSKRDLLRLVLVSLYAICLCCAVITFGIYSYFLVVLMDRDQAIPDWQRAVEGISGIAVLYAIAAMFFTYCLSSIEGFAFTAIILDTLFTGGFIAIAVLTRHGASLCSGVVNTPLGIGNTENNSGGFGSGDLNSGEGKDLTYFVSPHIACRFNTAAFAVSIIAAFIFTVTALLRALLLRKRDMDKHSRYSPAKDHNSGSAERSHRNHGKAADKDTELGVSNMVTEADSLNTGNPYNDVRLWTRPDTLEAQSQLLTMIMTRLMMPMDAALSSAAIKQLTIQTSPMAHEYEPTSMGVNALNSRQSRHRIKRGDGRSVSV